MSSLLLMPGGKRPPEQTQHNVPIDHEGLGKGIQLLLNPALGPIDIATGRAWTVGGDVKVEDVTRGKIFKYPGVDGDLHYTGYPEISGTVGTFFIWCPTVGPKDDWGHGIFGEAATTFFLAHQFGQFYHMGSESDRIFSWFNGTNKSLVCSSANATGAGLKVYQNGEDTGMLFSAAPTPWSSGAKTLTIGRNPGFGTVHDFNGTIRLVGYTKEVWGKAEAAAFHVNPWRIFKTRTRKLWVASVASTEHNLTIANGALANAAAILAISQIHAIAVANTSIANSASTLAVSQVHSLAMANGTLSNAAGTVTISQGAAITLAIAGIAISNSAASLALSQEHILALSTGTIANSAAVLSLSQVHALSIYSAGISNLAGTVALESSDVTLTIYSATIENSTDSVAITITLNSQWAEEASISSVWTLDSARTTTWS